MTSGSMQKYCTIDSFKNKKQKTKVNLQNAMTNHSDTVAADYTTSFYHAHITSSRENVNDFLPLQVTEIF